LNDIDKNQIKSFYDAFTTHLIKDRIYPNPRIARIFAYLDEILQQHRIERALEIGCGIGIISERLRKSVPLVVGVDIGENNIRFAAATVKNVQFICADFLEAKIDGQFDLITLFDVLEHFPKSQHRRIFEKISELSRPRTLVAVTIPDADFLDHYRELYPEKLQIVDESIHFDELLGHAQAVNLEIRTYRRYGIDFENQYRYYLLNYRDREFVLAPKIVQRHDTIWDVATKILRRLLIYVRKAKYSMLARQLFKKDN